MVPSRTMPPRTTAAPGGPTAPRRAPSRAGRGRAACLAAATLWLLLATAAMAEQINASGRADGRIVELEFKDTTVQDAIRIVSELSGVNIVATEQAGGRRFTLFLRDLEVRDAIDTISRVAGLWYRRSAETGVYTLMSTEEYLRDIVVFRDERTEIFTLRFQNVQRAARLIEAMFGEERVELDDRFDFTDELQVPGGTLSQALSGDGRGSTRFDRRTRRFDRDRRSTRRGDGRGDPRLDDPREEIDELSAAQIERIERAQAARGGDPLLLAESTVADVRRRSRAPIFVATNVEHNLLFVRTADERAMAEVRRIVRESDRPTPQVLLEMKVMSVDLDGGLRSAFDFSFGSPARSAGPPDGQPPNPLSPSASTGPQALLGAVNAGVVPGSSLVFQLMNEEVRARLQLLERSGRINVLATPLLLASNNRPAKIFIGEQTVLTTGFSAESTAAGGSDNTFIATPVPDTEVVEVGNTLTVLPSINADRTVLMRLVQESSRVNPGGGVVPVVTAAGVSQVPIDTVDTSTLEGTAMARDGLTVVVGGMITDSLSDSTVKVPLLGELPLLGTLFRDRDSERSKQELVLLITPHVLTTPEEAEAVSRERVGKLSSPGGPLEPYFEDLDEARESPAAASARSARERAYIELVRFASRAVRAPHLVPQSPGAAERPKAVSIEEPATPRSLLGIEGVAALTRGSWLRDGLFVTAVEVHNATRAAVRLDVRRLAGEWLAAAFERDLLAPQRRALGYLVSERPYAQAAAAGQAR